MRTIICGCDPWWGSGDACSERQATLDLLNSHWMNVPTEMREVPNALCPYVVAYQARLHWAVGASSKNHKETSQNGRKLKPKIETRVPARWLHSPRSNHGASTHGDGKGANGMTPRSLKDGDGKGSSNHLHTVKLLAWSRPGVFITSTRLNEKTWNSYISNLKISYHQKFQCYFS